MTEQRLYIGTRFTGVAVRPDSQWPSMWRIHHGDQVSDMVNLTRAKDAAVMWACPRGLGGSGVARWDRRETAAEVAPAPQKREGVGVIALWPQKPLLGLPMGYRPIHMR
jgi:hypothetical protein